MKSWNSIKIDSLDYGQLQTAKTILKSFMDDYKASDELVVKVWYTYKLYYLLFGFELAREWSEEKVKVSHEQYEDYKIGGVIISKRINKPLIIVPDDKIMYLRGEDCEKIEILIKLIDNYLEINEYKIKIKKCENEIIMLSQL